MSANFIQCNLGVNTVSSQHFVSTFSRRIGNKLLPIIASNIIFEKMTIMIISFIRSFNFTIIVAVFVDNMNGAIYFYKKILTNGPASQNTRIWPRKAQIKDVPLNINIRYNWNYSSNLPISRLFRFPIYLFYLLKFRYD